MANPNSNNQLRRVNVDRSGLEPDICEPFAVVHDYIEVDASTSDAEAAELVELYLASLEIDDPSFL